MVLHVQCLIPLGAQIGCNTLLNTQQTGFDFPKMQSILGPVHASIIAQSYEYHNFSPTIPDKLIFTFASNGLFTLKQGYQLLSQLHHRAPTVPQHAPSPNPWSILWQPLQIAPRIRLFIWKALHEAVPTSEILHHRIPHINPACPICQDPHETMSHLIFFLSSLQSYVLGSIPLLVLVRILARKTRCDFTAGLMVHLHNHTWAGQAMYCMMGMYCFNLKDKVAPRQLLLYTWKG